jgi:hypothetical protein
VKPIDESDVGGYFIDGSGKLWKMIAYSGPPTVTFEMLDETPGDFSWTPTRRSGVVGSPVIEDLARVRREGEGA